MKRASSTDTLESVLARLNFDITGMQEAKLILKHDLVELASDNRPAIVKSAAQLPVFFKTNWELVDRDKLRKIMVKWYRVEDGKLKVNIIPEQVKQELTLLVNKVSFVNFPADMKYKAVEILGQYHIRQPKAEYNSKALVAGALQLANQILEKELSKSDIARLTGVEYANLAHKARILARFCGVDTEIEDGKYPEDKTKPRIKPVHEYTRFDLSVIVEKQCGRNFSDGVKAKATSFLVTYYLKNPYSRRKPECMSRGAVYVASGLLNQYVNLADVAKQTGSTKGTSANISEYARILAKECGVTMPKPDRRPKSVIEEEKQTSDRLISYISDLEKKISEESMFFEKMPDKLSAGLNTMFNYARQIRLLRGELGSYHKDIRQKNLINEIINFESYIRMAQGNSISSLEQELRKSLSANVPDPDYSKNIRVAELETKKQELESFYKRSKVISNKYNQFWSEVYNASKNYESALKLGVSILKTVKGEHGSD